MAWGKHFNECQCCGTSEHKYHAKGLCTLCYHKKRYREDERAREIGKRATERWQKEHREHNLKLMREYAKKRKLANK